MELILNPSRVISLRNAGGTRKGYQIDTIRGFSYIMKLFSLSFSWALVLTTTSVCVAQTYTNGQAARLVIGQSTFTEADVGAQDILIGAAAGVAVGGGNLYVADANRFTSDPSNNRVLIIPTNHPQYPVSVFPSPTDDLTKAPFSPSPNGFNCLVCVGRTNVILGQPDANNSGVNLNQTGFRNPVGIATDGTHLIVADSDNNRVMIWNTIPTKAFNQPADVVIGQPDFTHNSTSNPPSATSLRGPQGVWILNGKLFIADTADNRVLVYNSIPTKNGQAADLVIGQSGFTVAIPTAQTTPHPTQSTLYSPVSVSTDGTHLFVADLGNNRVLIWNKIPTSNGSPADLVIGQPDFVSFFDDNSTALCASNGTDANSNKTYPFLCEKTLAFPRFVISDGTRLYIADGGNDRVLIYNTIPTSNAAAADIVLGQPDFTSDSPADGAAQMYTPTSLAWDGTNLYVADNFNRRILAFTPSTSLLPLSSVRNAASLENFAIGTITVGGTITAKDTIAVTIRLNDVNGTALNTATYTYTVQTNDTVNDIVNGLVALINKNPGDKNVTAEANASRAQIILTAKQGGFPGVYIGYSTVVTPAVTGVAATEAASTAGANLTINLEDATQIAPGTLMTIFGSDLADTTAVGTADAGGYYPFSLGGAEVYVDGIRAALVSVSPTQINAQMPFVVFDRSSSSIYVRTIHKDGTVTATTPSAASVPLANPGIFAAPGTDPRPGYVYHAYQNATAVLSVDGAITAGDVGNVTIGSASYKYTVQGTDTLSSVMQGIVNLINTDSNSVVTAYPSNVFQRILLVANEPGAAGEGVPLSVSVTTGKGLILTALSSQTCCANPQGGLVTDDNPAQPGEVVYIYATGLGITTNQSALDSGQAPTTENIEAPATPVDSILAGGSTANIIFTRYVPGLLGTFQVTFQLSSGITDNPLTQLTIAQQSFVSNVVTFNVMTGEAASLSGAANPASDTRPRMNRTVPAPPADPAQVLRIPQRHNNPAVKAKPFRYIDKSLQKKV
jgi:uncharacterized protein (TIGR03437 family)